jgi:hypothetical protein
MELFAREEIADPLIESVMLAHEPLSLAPDALSPSSILQIVAALRDA